MSRHSWCFQLPARAWNDKRPLRPVKVMSDTVEENLVVPDLAEQIEVRFRLAPERGCIYLQSRTNDIVYNHTPQVVDASL
jgi:hypothetical protein